MLVEFPIFGAGINYFPTEISALRVFEPRYLLLIGDSILNKQNFAENKAKAVLNSRFQTIGLLSYLGQMNKNKQSKVAIGLLKYGKSQSDWSAPHLKVQ